MFTSNSTAMSVFKDPTIFTTFRTNSENSAHLSSVVFADFLFRSVFGVVGVSNSEQIMVICEMFFTSLLDREADDDQKSKKNELFKHWI